MRTHQGFSGEHTSSISFPPSFPPSLSCLLTYPPSSLSTSYPLSPTPLPIFPSSLPHSPNQFPFSSLHNQFPSFSILPSLPLSIFLPTQLPNSPLSLSYPLSLSPQSTTDDLMRFVKELRRANSGLVDAFEKSKKRQQAEKRRMKQELVSYMNKLQATGGQAEVRMGDNCVSVSENWC